MGLRTKLPPLKALHAFAIAANHLNFSKAADEMCVTAAAVSYQVRLLEGSLHTTLFRRLPRGLELTREGAALQSVCEKAFADIAQVAEAVRSEAEHLEIRMASVPHFSARVLFGARQQFLRLYPLYNVELDHTLDTPDFSKQGYDFAVLFGKGEWSGLDSELLFNSATAPACSPSLLERSSIHSPADIANAPVLLDHSCFHAMWVDWFKEAGAEGWEKLTYIPCNDIHALLGAASQGFGVVMEPEFVVWDLLSAGTLVLPFEAKLSNYGYHLVYPRETMHKASCRTFRDWLVPHVDSLGLT